MFASTTRVGLIQALGAMVKVRAADNPYRSSQSSDKLQLQVLSPRATYWSSLAVAFISVPFFALALSIYVNLAFLVIPFFVLLIAICCAWVLRSHNIAYREYHTLFRSVLVVAGVVGGMLLSLAVASIFTVAVFTSFAPWQGFKF